MISRSGKFVRLYLAISALLLLTSLSHASVEVSIDRPVVYEGESFTLVISSDAKQREMPDLSLLKKDFYVLGTSSSQQVQIINGVTSAKTSWTITLQAKKSGQLHIPSLRVGKELTNPVQVTVTAPPEASSATEGQHIFIETEIAATNKPVYLQQQILYTVRLVFDEPILEGSLSEPAAENALVEKLGKDNRYSSQRNGKAYTVIERRYAIFPEKSGKLVMPPLRFTGSQVSNAAKRQPRPRIDPGLQRFFGGDPFAGVFDRGKPVTVQGKDVSIEILPRPASYTSGPWLPSAKLELNDSWVEQPPEFKAGEPVSRTITIQAKGLLATLLPTLKLDAVDGVNVYPEQPVTETRTDGSWVYGISKQSVSYMPTKAGELIIPELELSWWDTNAGVARKEVLPEWKVMVLPGKNPVAEPVAPAVEQTEAKLPSDSSIAEKAEGDNSLQQADWFNDMLKKYGVLLLIFALVIFVLYRKRSKTSAAADTEPVDKNNTVDKQSLRELQKNLLAASSRNDASATAEVLLQMAAQLRTGNPPKTLPALAVLLEHGSEEIIRLDRILYARNDADWNGQQFYEKFRHGLVFAVDEKPAHETLQPLYPAD